MPTKYIHIEEIVTIAHPFIDAHEGARIAKRLRDLFIRSRKRTSGYAGSFIEEKTGRLIIDSSILFAVEDNRLLARYRWENSDKPAKRFTDGVEFLKKFAADVVNHIYLTRYADIVKSGATPNGEPING